MGPSLPSLPVPQFPIELEPPDITDWIAGNTGISGFTTVDSGQPGPHAALLALTHGNEFAGAIVLNRLLRATLRPKRGRLSFGFVNLEAFSRFDPTRPTLSRFIDEDINRVWDESVLNSPRRSRELDRAREIRPFLETVDALLDLHTMLWPSDPLILSGASHKGRALAAGIGTPPLVVADSGHMNGKRIIDYTRFSEPETAPVANLVEAGQHWRRSTVDTTSETVDGFLRHMGLVSARGAAQVSRVRPGTPQRCAVVTDVITASTRHFAFIRQFHGGEIIARRNTLLALDGDIEVRTPHDECLLVMPTLRPSRGHTAVRLARFEKG